MTPGEVFALNFKRMFEDYKARGGTQTSLAAAAGATQGQISLWLRGTQPSLENLPGLARALSRSIDDFFNLESVKASPRNALVPGDGPELRELLELLRDRPEIVADALVLVRGLAGKNKAKKRATTKSV